MVCCFQLDDTKNILTTLVGIPNILIVDDEPLVCWTLETSLKKAGYNVATADSGETAIEKIKSTHFDLIITDMKLPQADGFEVIRLAKQVSPDIGIIMISAYGDQSVKLKADENSIDYFVDKPFNLTEFNLLVKQIIKKHER